MMKQNVFQKVFTFYYDGFKSMTVGKKLWIIILIKFFILFGVFRLFLFPDILNEKFKNDEERSEYILDQLTKE